MKKILILIMLLGIIGLISGISTLGNFPQGECVQLMQICGTCTYNNVSSILRPDGTQVALNVEMERDKSNYNHTYCNTANLGRYIINGFGDLNGITTGWTYELTISPRGDEQDRGITELVILITIAICLSTLIFLKLSRFFGSMMIFISGIGIMFRNPTNGWVGWIITAIGFIMLLYSLLSTGGGRHVIRRRRRRRR